jgi:hypothetical protein
VLDGVIDLQVHADPDVDARSLDDTQVTAKYGEVGAGAVLLKLEEFALILRCSRADSRGTW